MSPKKDAFKGKMAIVAGGSSGMGKEIAKQLVLKGTSVAILARSRDKLNAAKKEIEDGITGQDLFVDVLQADVTDKSQIEKEFNDFLAKRGTPDFLFNCAGACFPKLIEDYTIADYEDAMRLNYLGTVITTMELLPRFISEKKGHLINISSAGGYIGIIGLATYVPAKFAVVGFSEVLRHELKPKGIKVSVVFPPDTDTPGFEEENKTKPEACKIVSGHGNLMQPDEVARVILKGVKKDKFYIFPGNTKFIFKMKAFFPGLVYKIIDDDLKKANKIMESRSKE
ncbi:MAG: SDR family oxidoreductase [Candidatus Hodarchaeota archaeon]